MAVLRGTPDGVLDSFRSSRPTRVPPPPELTHCICFLGEAPFHVMAAVCGQASAWPGFQVPRYSYPIQSCHPPILPEVAIRVLSNIPSLILAGAVTVQHDCRALARYGVLS